MRGLQKRLNGTKRWGCTMISAVYDACVLYSASLRDILFCLADKEFISPLWSEEIHNEWIRSLLRNRPDLLKEKLERTCQKMDFHFPNGLVRGYEVITPTLSLPDPNDRHVLSNTSNLSISNKKHQKKDAPLLASPNCQCMGIWIGLFGGMIYADFLTAPLYTHTCQILETRDF